MFDRCDGIMLVNPASKTGRLKNRCLVAELPDRDWPAVQLERTDGIHRYCQSMLTVRTAATRPSLLSTGRRMGNRVSEVLSV